MSKKSRSNTPKNKRHKKFPVNQKSKPDIFVEETETETAQVVEETETETAQVVEETETETGQVVEETETETGQVVEETETSIRAFIFDEFKSLFYFSCFLMLSCLFWICIIFISTILIWMIKHGNAQSTFEIVMLIPALRIYPIIYIIIILMLIHFKNYFPSAKKALDVQLNQFYFSIPILASLLFLAIDRITPA